MATLSLGKVDSDAMPVSKSEFLERYHQTMQVSLGKTKFRDEGNGVWRDFEVQAGSEVRGVQQFLHNAGFLPKTDMIDGIFGYSTQAAVRLFQEYVRTVEGIDCTPDGEVGPNTRIHIQRWMTGGLRSEWANWSNHNPSPEYAQWLSLLGKSKAHFKANGSEILNLVNQHPNPGDTRKIDHWEDSADQVHLIGLRQGEEAAATSRDYKGRFTRENDDLFILLINGMVFKFWGSTDPTPVHAKDSGNPFLVEGQHHYRFGWHKVDDAQEIYRALRAATDGVLVYRVPEGAGLTAAEVAEGLASTPNDTINIHWSGSGRSNWSAGCQVISGSSYINHKGNVVSCAKYVAGDYTQLGGKPKNPSWKGRGAYNVFTDLLLSYGPPGVNTIAYTLGRDETLRLADVPEWKDANFVPNTVKRMKDAK